MSIKYEFEEKFEMELIYKRLEQNKISMCADTLIKAFKEEPWNEMAN